MRQAEVALDKARADDHRHRPRSARPTCARRSWPWRRPRNDLAKLKTQQTSAWDVRLAELEMQANEAALAKLRSPQPFDAQAAQVAYDLAVAKLELLQKGPSEAELSGLRAQIASLELAIESARTAIPSAEASVGAAQASLEAKRQGATEFDVRDAAVQGGEGPERPRTRRWPSWTSSGPTWGSTDRHRLRRAVGGEGSARSRSWSCSAWSPTSTTPASSPPSTARSPR